MTALKKSNAKRPGSNLGGRPHGAVNKLGAAAKDNIAAVFNELGGTQRMLEFFRGDDLDVPMPRGLNEQQKASFKYRLAIDKGERLKLFYEKVYPKLIPVQVVGPGGGAINIHISAEDEKL